MLITLNKEFSESIVSTVLIDPISSNASSPKYSSYKSSITGKAKNKLFSSPTKKYKTNSWNLLSKPYGDKMPLLLPLSVRALQPWKWISMAMEEEDLLVALLTLQLESEDIFLDTSLITTIKIASTSTSKNWTMKTRTYKSTANRNNLSDSYFLFHW